VHSKNFSIAESCQPGPAEDDPNDAALVQSSLEAAGIMCATTCVRNRADFVAALERGAIAQHGVLKAVVALLPKPYTRATLVCKVREGLDPPRTEACK